MVYVGAHTKMIQEAYPIYRGGFASAAEFAWYELCYLLFFIAIEFIIIHTIILALSIRNKILVQCENFSFTLVFEKSATEETATEKPLYSDIRGQRIRCIWPALRPKIVVLGGVLSGLFQHGSNFHLQGIHY